MNNRNICCINYRSSYNYSNIFSSILNNSRWTKSILPFKTVKNQDIEIYNLNKTNSKTSPIILLIGVIHGDETSGCYVVEYFMKNIDNGNHEDILSRYQISVIPLLNKDNFQLRRRNANNVDLNRDFKFSKNHKFQIESKAIISYYENNPNIAFQFVFHSGALCVCYPLNQKYNEYSVNRNNVSMMNKIDNALYYNLSKKYSKYHNKSLLKKKYNDSYEYTNMYNSRYFSDNGVINENEWYAINGSINDYAYIKYGIPTITIEATNCKNTNPKYCEIIGRDHYASIIKSILYLNKNYICGVITDENKNPLSDIKIDFNSNNFCKTTIDGTFFRFVDSKFNNTISINNKSRDIKLNECMSFIY
jgi:hypothetical protein